MLTLTLALPTTVTLQAVQDPIAAPPPASLPPAALEAWCAMDGEVGSAPTVLCLDAAAVVVDPFAAENAAVHDARQLLEQTRKRKDLARQGGDQATIARLQSQVHLQEAALVAATARRASKMPELPRRQSNRCSCFLKSPIGRMNTTLGAVGSVTLYVPQTGASGRRP